MGVGGFEFLEETQGSVREEEEAEKTSDEEDPGEEEQEQEQDEEAEENAEGEEEGGEEEEDDDDAGVNAADGEDLPATDDSASDDEAEDVADANAPTPMRCRALVKKHGLKPGSAAKQPADRKTQLQQALGKPFLKPVYCQYKCGRMRGRDRWRRDKPKGKVCWKCDRAKTTLHGHNKTTKDVLALIAKDPAEHERFKKRCDSYDTALAKGKRNPMFRKAEVTSSRRFEEELQLSDDLFYTVKQYMDKFNVKKGQILKKFGHKPDEVGGVWGVRVPSGEPMRVKKSLKNTIELKQTHANQDTADSMEDLENAFQDLVGDTALPDAVGMSAPQILQDSGFDLSVLMAFGSAGAGAAMTAGLFVPKADDPGTGQQIRITLNNTPKPPEEEPDNSTVARTGAFSFRGGQEPDGAVQATKKGSKPAKEAKNSGILALLQRRKVAMSQSSKPAPEKKEKTPKESTGEDNDNGGVETRGRKARTQEQVIETYQRAVTDVMNAGPNAIVWNDPKSPALSALTRFRKEAKNKMDFAKDDKKTLWHRHHKWLGIVEDLVKTYLGAVIEGKNGRFLSTFNDKMAYAKQEPNPLPDVTEQRMPLVMRRQVHSLRQTEDFGSKEAMESLASNTLRSLMADSEIPSYQTEKLREGLSSLMRTGTFAEKENILNFVTNEVLDTAGRFTASISFEVRNYQVLLVLTGATAEIKDILVDSEQVGDSLVRQLKHLTVGIDIRDRADKHVKGMEKIEGMVAEGGNILAELMKLTFPEWGPAWKSRTQRNKLVQPLLVAFGFVDTALEWVPPTTISESLMNTTVRKTVQEVDSKICFYVKPVMGRIIEGWLAYIMAQLSKEGPVLEVSQGDMAELAAVKDALAFAARIPGTRGEGVASGTAENVSVTHDAEVGRVQEEATALLALVDPEEPAAPLTETTAFSQSSLTDVSWPAWTGLPKEKAAALNQLLTKRVKEPALQLITSTMAPLLAKYENAIHSVFPPRELLGTTKPTKLFLPDDVELLQAVVSTGFDMQSCSKLCAEVAQKATLFGREDISIQVQAFSKLASWAYHLAVVLLRPSPHAGEKLWRLGSAEEPTPKLVEELVLARNAQQALETFLTRVAGENKTLCITENLRGGPRVLVDWPAVLEGGRSTLRTFLNALGDATSKDIELLRPIVEKGCVLKKEEIDNTLHQDKEKVMKLLGNDTYDKLQLANRDLRRTVKGFSTLKQLGVPAPGWLSHEEGLKELVLLGKTTVGVTMVCSFIAHKATKLEAALVVEGATGLIEKLTSASTTIPEALMQCLQRLTRVGQPAASSAASSAPASAAVGGRRPAATSTSGPASTSASTSSASASTVAGRPSASLRALSAASSAEKKESVASSTAGGGGTSVGTEEASLARQRLKKRGAEEESASVPAVTALGGETSAGTEEVRPEKQASKRNTKDQSAIVPPVTALGGETSARTAEVRPEKQESKRKAEDQSAGDGDAGAKGDGSENGAVRKRPRRN